MVNHLKGEVSFEADGKTLIFRMGVNELIDFQGKMGLAGQDDKLWVTLEENMRSPAVLRKIVWCGLLRRQPDITEEAAGDVIAEIGLPAVVKIVMEGLRWALPEAKEPEPGEKGESRPSDGPTSS